MKRELDKLKTDRQIFAQKKEKAATFRFYV